MTRDYVEAVNWFRKAADQNLAGAQDTLGDCSVMGVGMAKDAVQGYLVSQSGRAKLRQSAISSRALLRSGQGVAKEPTEAYKWSLLATRQGDEKAKALVAAMQKEMTPAQIAEGSGRASSSRARRHLPERR